MIRPWIMRNVHRTTVVQAVVLFGFWLALSQRSDPLFIVTGIVTALVVTAVTHRIAGACLRHDVGHLPVGQIPLAAVRAVTFAIWMSGRILMASVQLAVIALSRNMPLDPCTLRFTTQLRRPIARATLANSISLVPGTLTVDIEDNELTVHALNPAQVQDLVTGVLQNKVAKLFLEAEQPALDPSALQQGEVS